MITFSTTRDKDGEHFSFPSRQVDQKEALELLVKYELAFGGKVADVSKTFLRVKTKVFHCMDTALFEGTEEEMLPLLQIAHLYTQEVLNEKDPKVFENMADFILDKTGGKPLFISLGADILAGNHRLRRIMEKYEAEVKNESGN